ncbi:MAG TPA: response regulator transcription factor [Polyangiaceae bacterium]|nr:response regulator transcription factor [Polyangiaceae bacterium]
MLLIEDDRRVAEVVAHTLRPFGHAVVSHGSHRAAVVAIADASFDLAILDIALPDGTGLDLCRMFRAQGLVFPILMLTARSGVAERVAGLDAGADDYLGKPFAPAELAARVRALGRRGPRWTESVRAFGDLRLDRDRRIVSRNDARIPLTPREFEVVALLAWRDGRVVSKDEVLEIVWGEVTDGAAASLEVVIARLRRKLDDRKTPSFIRTVRQVGYAWEPLRSKHA